MVRTCAGCAAPLRANQSVCARCGTVVGKQPLHGVSPLLLGLALASALACVAAWLWAR